MVLEQFPPPPANLSFPPKTSGQLSFNYIDSFVTTWVMPEGSHEPCFLSLYFWNSSAPNKPWRSKFNESVSLNSTDVVTLNMIGSDGLAQLNLDYVNPVSSHQRVLGPIFHVAHDPTQPKTITWNENALSSSSSSSPASSSSSLLSSSEAATAGTAATSATAATSTPGLAASVATVPPSSTNSHLQTAKTITQSYTSTSTVLPVKSSSSSSAKIASITLGIILGVVFATALFMFWIRKRRQKRTSAQADCVPSPSPFAVGTQTVATHEKDAEPAATELGVPDSRWELGSSNR